MRRNGDSRVLRQGIEEVVRTAESGVFDRLDTIEDGLRGDIPEVRMKAAFAAERIGSPRFVDSLSRMALHDEESPNRNQAIYALGGIATPAVVPVLAAALGDSDGERREDARTVLYRMLGRDVINLFADEDDEVDDSRSEELGVLDWWANRSVTVAPHLVYFHGEPASLGRVIEEVERLGPDPAEAFLGMLHDWTGEAIEGDSATEIAAAWRRWVAKHGRHYEVGRRYFHGHPVP
jgi:HEAT repeat protein